MKKASDFISFDSQFLSRKKKSVDELYQKKEIKYFLAKHKLTKEIIEDNWIDFLEYSEDIITCPDCQKRIASPKNFDGYHYSLDYQDGQIKKVYFLCPSKEELHQERQMLNRIVKNVPESLLRTTFENISLNNKGNVTDVLITLNNFIDHPTKKGIYLYGAMGVGKSYIMAAFINRLAKKGYDCGFISVPELLSGLKREFNSNGNQDDIVTIIKEVPYLVLDDVGAESLTAWSRDDIIYNIVNERMNRGYATFFTSVYDLADLERHYMQSKTKEERVKAQRIIERIKAISSPLELNGINFRD